MTPCLIVNPRSYRASRNQLAERAATLARQYGAEVVAASDSAQFTQLFTRLHAGRYAQIFVLAGDGTVHALAQYLAQLPVGDWSPALLLLGGGRSNTVPRDSGGHPALPRLVAALRAWRAGRSLPMELRPVLRIEQQGLPTQHGFVFAGAMIDAGIRLCRDFRMSGDGWFHKGPLGDPYHCLAKLAVQVLFGSSPLPPYPELVIRTDSGDALAGPSRLFLATALLHREGVYNPYADRGAGPVRVTAVNATAPHFWRRLPRLLTGRFNEKMSPQNGYLSGRYERVEVTGLGSYCLDGELYTVDPARALWLSGRVNLRVLQP